MDGLFHGNPYFLMDDLGVPLFLETPISPRKGTIKKKKRTQPSEPTISFQGIFVSIFRGGKPLSMDYSLVGGFNPFEKYYSSQIGSFPQGSG